MTTNITSTHAYTGHHDDQLTTWLADTPHHWDGDGDLVIDTPDGEIHPRPGSWLVRWTDDEVTVASPRTAHRTYGPQGLAGRLRAAEAALARVRERCQQVRDRVGPGGMINASQILGLLSPTWPDGNYEAAPASPDEQYRFATEWSEYHAGRKALDEPKEG